VSAAPVRRYRSDGEPLTDGFTLRIPTALNGDLRRLSRILGVSIGDFATRAIEERIERETSDPDIAAALAAIARIDERLSGAPPEGPRTSGETPAKSAGSAERPHSRASRSAGTRRPETRAPAAAEGPVSPSAAPAQPDIDWPALGARLRAARNESHVTQVTVAFEMGVSSWTICQIETGKGQFSPALARRIDEWIKASDPAAAAPATKKPNPVPRLALRGKVTPSSEHRRPDLSQTLPRALPPGLETFPCVALKSPKMTERTCAANKARAKGDVWLEEHCTDCPGVRALAKRTKGSQ